MFGGLAGCFFFFSDEERGKDRGGGYGCLGIRGLFLR